MTFEKRPFSLCKGVMKLPGPWDVGVCQALAHLWFENLKVLYIKSSPNEDRQYLGAGILTEIGKFLRTVKARNYLALREGKCLSVIRELEYLLASSNDGEVSVRVRALLMNLRELLGENPLEAYAYPIFNTKNTVFSIRPGNEIHLNTILRFIAEISIVSEEIQIAKSDFFGKHIDRFEANTKIQKQLGLSQSLLEAYSKYRRDMRPKKGRIASFPKGFPMGSFGHLISDQDSPRHLTVEEAATLWKRLESLSYNVADFGRNAPPRPDLLFAGRINGVEFSKHLMSANGTAPTRKWINGADNLADKIGQITVAQNLTKWLLLADVGPISDRTCMDRVSACHLIKSANLLNWLLDNGATMREAAIIANGDSSLMPLHFPERPKPYGAIAAHGCEPFILSSTNTILGKAAVWWLCRLKPNGVEETLARVCSALGMRVFHHNNGTPGPVTRSLAVANACVSGLVDLNTETSQAALEGLRGHNFDPRLMKRINTFL